MGKVTLEKPVSEFKSSGGGGGGDFVKPYHAYKATIEPADANGWTKLKVTTIDAKSGQYDALSAHQNSKYHDDTIGKWSYAVIASNPTLSQFEGNTEIDTDKWGGLAIGVVYRPQQKKNEVTGVYEDSKFCEPWFAIPIDQVDSFKVQQDKYDDWYAKFWGAGAESDAVNEAPKVMAPIDDDLPF